VRPSDGTTNFQCKFEIAIKFEFKEVAEKNFRRLENGNSLKIDAHFFIPV